MAADALPGILKTDPTLTGRHCKLGLSRAVPWQAAS